MLSFTTTGIPKRVPSAVPAAIAASRLSASSRALSQRVMKHFFAPPNFSILSRYIPVSSREVISPQSRAERRETYVSLVYCGIYVVFCDVLKYRFRIFRGENARREEQDKQNCGNYPHKFHFHLIFTFIRSFGYIRKRDYKKTLKSGKTGFRVRLVLLREIESRTT